MTDINEKIQAGIARAQALPDNEKLTITDRAARHISNQISKSEGAIGLRLGTRKSGCSGWAYLIDLAFEPSDTDLIFDFNGVRVLLDPEVMPMLKGTEIDFVSEGLSQMLKFNNPNVSATCGCGESFAIKE